MYLETAKQNPSVKKQPRCRTECCKLSTPWQPASHMHLPVALPGSAPDSAERPFLPVAQSHLLQDCYRTRDRWYHFPSISRSPLGRNFSIQDTVPCCLPPFHANLEGLKSTVFKIVLYYSSITSLLNHTNVMALLVFCSLHAFNA